MSSAAGTWAVGPVPAFGSTQVGTHDRVLVGQRSAVLASPATLRESGRGEIAAFGSGTRGVGGTDWPRAVRWLRAVRFPRVARTLHPGPLGLHDAARYQRKCTKIRPKFLESFSTRWYLALISF